MTYDEYKSLTENTQFSGQKAVFDEYFPYVYTVVRSKLVCCGAHEDVEECVSDIFADIYAYLDSNAEYKGDLKGIISVIAKRKAVNYYQRLNPHKDFTEELTDNCELYSHEKLEADYEKKEQRRFLLEAIEKLGMPDSEILIRKYFFGYKSKEISQILGLSPTAVRMRSSRALKRLKKMLENSKYDF